MKDENKTKQQLISELSELRQTIAELKIIETKKEERFRHIKQLEEQLAAERKRLFSILDGLPALVYLVATDYSLRFSNRFFQERFEKPKDKPCYMIFHGRTTPCKLCVSFKNGKAIESLKCHRTYSNGYTYEIYNYPFTDVDGSRMLLSFGIDITDRKQAEKALYLSEEKFSKAFHCSPDPITITSLPNGHYIEINEAWVVTSGYETHEAIDRSSLELGVWDVPQERDLFLKQIQEQGRIRNSEARFRIKSGEILTCLVSAMKIDMDGEPHLLCIHKDITERKHAEMALKLSEEKFSKAFHCSPDMFTISTLKEGRYIEVNDAYLDILGYERNEVIGHTSDDIGVWDFPIERDQLLKQIQEQGSVRNFETHRRTKNRGILTTLLSADVIYMGGEPHLLCVHKDISDRKRMEETLRLSEECLSKAFNTSPIIMTITALEDGRFIKANNAFCRIWGFNHEEIMEHSSLELGFWLNPADRNLVKQMIMAKQSIQDMEIGFCKKNGEQRLGLYSAEGLEIDGELCMLSVLTDITDLRQMEVEMTRLDRLNLVGEMAASIGHEIRNPMTTVRGYLQLLRENKDYVQEIEYFDLMIEELDRANSIITEFLSLAKNKMVDMTPRNLNSIISKSLPLILAKAMTQDRCIKLELHDLPYLLLDKKEIRQLILNLINNGMESMSLPGDVTIRTFVEKEDVVLAVQDQGHGIDPELLDKLGTPFFTTKEQGTGLGLAVCYRIANRHNAKIDIDTSSTGTTFYVRFPIFQ